MTYNIITNDTKLTMKYLLPENKTTQKIILFSYQKNIY